MKKVNQSFMLCILLILCISDQTVVFASRSMDEKAVKGIIDLSTINEQEMVALSGEWEFYWRQFLEPGDFNNQTQKPNYMKVPSLWKGHMIENKPIGSTGYATYRLKIHINPNDIGKEKVLLVDEVSSAYKVWIDGKEKKERVK